MKLKLQRKIIFTSESDWESSNFSMDAMICSFRNQFQSTEGVSIKEPQLQIQVNDQ